MNSKTRNLLTVVFLSIFLILCSFMIVTTINKTAINQEVYADWSGSGSGTEADPYIVATKADLEAVRANVSSSEGKYYKMTSNIDLSSGTWSPIGVMGNYFKGVFDGNGYTISGLNINDSTGQFLGLFGVIYGATIKNLKVEGSVVGDAICGLVGMVIGNTASNIINCHADIDVTATTGYVGGFVGYNDEAVLNITNCYNTGTITGAQYTGGIIGMCTPQSSSNPTVVITKCYNLGSIVSDNANRGSIIGSEINNKVSVVDTYYLNTSIEPADYRGAKISGGSELATALTAEQIKEKSSFNNWNFGADWVMGDEYPILPVVNVQLKGSGTFDDPFEIYTFADFYKFKVLVNGTSLEYCGILLNDIDADNLTTWVPIGNENKNYLGYFNGNGHIISHLNLNMPEYYSGLFGTVGLDGQVWNLSIGGEFTFDKNSGGIAGRNKGIIGGCVNYADITGVGNIGGIVASNDSSGKVEKCVNFGSISAQYVVGGIVGGLNGIILNSYNVGTITATWYHVGGIAGTYNDGIIQKCHNQGTIVCNHSGTVNTEPGQAEGGIASAGNNTEMTGCFMRNASPNKLSSSPLIVEGIISDEDFKNQDIFENAGWDFDKVWKMGDSYPVLQLNCGLRIDGMVITPDKLVGNGWKFDIASNTLTLENYTFNGEGSVNGAVSGAICYYGQDKLTIEVKGTNNITITNAFAQNTDAAISSEAAPVEIKGDGILNINMTFTSEDLDELPQNSYGILVNDDAVILGATLNINSARATFVSNAISVSGTLTVNGGSINATAKESNWSSAGIYAYDSLIVNGGTIVAAAADSLVENSMSSGIYASLVLNGGSVTAIAGDADYSAGINTEGADIEDCKVVINGGKLIARGSNNATRQNSCGIYCYYWPTNLVVGADVESVEISGGKVAVLGTIANAVLGYGYQDAEGTQGGQSIPLNVGEGANGFKKLVFPYVSPEPGTTPGTTPGPTPGTTPGPTPGTTPGPTLASKRVDENSGVSVETSDGTAIPQDITLKVVVKAEVTKVEGKVDPALIQAKLKDKEVIAKVYDVKLIQTIDGIAKEIQPSEIKEGMTIKVQFELPKDVKTKGLRILHVHNDGTIDEINNVALNGRVVTVEVASLSEFVIVNEASHGFCIGWLVFIFVMLEMLCACVYAILRFGLIKEIVAKCKLDSLYGKMDLLTLIGLCVCGAIFIFALIVLCLHQCTISIISFILTTIICGGFSCFFVQDEGIIKELKKEPQQSIEDKADDKEVEEPKSE